MNGSKNIFYNLDEEEVKEEATNTIDDYIDEPYDKNENKEDDVIITYNDDTEEDFSKPDVTINSTFEEKEEKKEEKEDLFNLIDNMYSDDDDDEEDEE